MDISTPPSENRSREWRVETIAAQLEAIDEVLLLARRHIRIFDADLSQGGWNGVARTAALAGFLRDRDARLDVIVHETRWVEANAPRFVQLLRQFGSGMTLYRTGPAARGAMDPLLIIDERHFVHRFHVDQPRASVAIDMAHAAKPLLARFEEIWATGEPGLAGTVLGL